jgi:exodeoxyribonuclease VII small subunit
MATKKNAHTFESALERIEQIATQMEKGDLALDQLMANYEEGLRLIRFCSERLEDAERRLETITRDPSGQPKGLATIQSPEEIPSSTPPETSASQQDTGDPADPSGPARLF